MNDDFKTILVKKGLNEQQIEKAIKAVGLNVNVKRLVQIYG